MEKNNLIFLILFILYSQVHEKELSSFNNENIQDEIIELTNIYEQNMEIIYLDEEMNQTVYNIWQDHSLFINNNSELIYIFESNSSNLIINNAEGKGLRNLNILEYGSKITVNMTGSFPEIIKITSIPNSNVYIEPLFEQNYDNLYLKQKFTNIKIIETADNNLIAHFDSFDENHEIYYANYMNDKIIPKDIYPINKEKFNKLNFKDVILTLEPNSTYIIINDVTEFYLSSLEVFITPKENVNQEIILHANTEKYLYLNKYQRYSINLNDISDFRIMKLSRKTSNSKIIINDNIVIDKDNMYYELEKKTILNLRIESEDALIEFLYYFHNEIIIDQLESNKQKIDGDKILIKLDSPDTYEIKLETNLNNAFGTSIYAKFSKGNYHYYSKECHSSLIYGFSFEETINKEVFENINQKVNESYNVYLYFLKGKEEQEIYLSLYPKNLKKDILNSANFTNIELDPEKTYKYTIQNDNTYTFKLSLDDNNIKSYYPIFTFENKTNYNETKLVMKNEGNNKNTSIYLNYYKNWTKDEDIRIKIIAEQAENILIVFYIFSGIVILVCLALCVLVIKKMSKGERQNDEGQINELLNKE